MSSISGTAALGGVWKRLWEEDPLGDAAGADRDTLVLWAQTPQSGIYVDIRLPPASPGVSEDAARAAGYVPTPTALEAVGLTTIPAGAGGDGDGRQRQQHLPVFLKQKSFAGVLRCTPGDTTASGEALRRDGELGRLAAEATTADMAAAGALPLCTCFWRRDVDYQPPPKGLDVGVCASGPINEDGSTDLRETGADASYAEGWHRLPGSDGGPCFALRLVSEGGVERAGYWVRTGRYFSYVVGRPTDSATASALGCNEKSAALERYVGKSLEEALKTQCATAAAGDNNVAVQLELLGSYVAVAGEIEDEGDGRGAASWKIKHSTDPGLVGCHLVGTLTTPLCCSTLTVLSGDAIGDNLQVGDVVCQVIAGTRNKVRQWEAMEIDGRHGLP